MFSVRYVCWLHNVCIFWCIHDLQSKWSKIFVDHLTKYHLLIMIQNSFSFNLSKPSKGLAPSLGKSCLQICRVGLQASNPLGELEWKCMQWKLHHCPCLLPFLPKHWTALVAWVANRKEASNFSASWYICWYFEDILEKKNSQRQKCYWWISITSLFPLASWNIPNPRQSNSQALCCWYRHQVPLDDHWRSLLPQWQFLCVFTSNAVSWDSAEELWHSCSQRSADEVSHPSTLKWPSIRGFVDKSLTENHFKEERCQCWESELLDYMCNVYNMMCNWL